MALESVLGGIVGLSGSLAPAILGYFDKKHERKHNEEMRRIEMEAVKAGHKFQLEQAEIVAGQTETAAVYSHDESLSEGGGTIMATIRASVRPIITYVFFMLFLAIKLSGLYTAWWVQNVPLTPALVALWDPNTEALFAAIMGFWFGHRAILKFGYGPAQSGPKIVATQGTIRGSK